MFSWQWANLCRSHLIEARWFRSGYIPTVSEYLENSCISVGAYAAAIHAYILQGFTLTESSLHCLKNGSELLYWSSLIARLSDDLATWEVCLVQYVYNISIYISACIIKKKKYIYNIDCDC